MTAHKKAVINKRALSPSCIAIVGLGYVGLPLAIEFGKIFKTIGYDVNQKRVADLKRFCDSNHDSSPAEIQQAKQLYFTDDPKELKKSSFIIIAVPTPVTSNKQPDLSFVESASRTVGRNLQKGSLVVFEPTVYPGVTEEICVPILEKESGFKYRKDFKVGYSPERINPGDKQHTLTNVIKIVSGCDEESLESIASVYERIVKPGVFRAVSIKTAEAAKIIENTQR
jgi:UDP-N-acetyl-D-galactosamine dehydrogenase